MKINPCDGNSSRITALGCLPPHFNSCTQDVFLCTPPLEDENDTQMCCSLDPSVLKTDGNGQNRASKGHGRASCAILHASSQDKTS